MTSALRHRTAFARAALLLVALATTGCQSMLFRQDHRIEILSPTTASTVPQPVTLRWSARDFSAPRDGRFAVFVDRDPMPAGETMAYFSPHDRHDIYLLDATTLKLDELQPLPGTNSAEANHHDVTVILLDAGGHRIGESAGFTEFTVKTSG